MKLQQTIQNPDLQRAQVILENQAWIFAKTMPSTPHWYTLRRLWAKDEDFVWILDLMREDGYDEIYGGRPFRVMNVNGFKYWTYWTVPPLAPDTDLINRKPLSAPGK